MRYLFILLIPFFVSAQSEVNTFMKTHLENLRETLPKNAKIFVISEYRFDDKILDTVDIVYAKIDISKLKKHQTYWLVKYKLFLSKNVLKILANDYRIEKINSHTLNISNMNHGEDFYLPFTSRDSINN